VNTTQLPKPKSREQLQSEYEVMWEQYMMESNQVLDHPSKAGSDRVARIACCVREIRKQLRGVN
jgi:hypothetical protein